MQAPATHSSRVQIAFALTPHLATGRIGRRLSAEFEFNRTLLSSCTKVLSAFSLTLLDVTSLRCTLESSAIYLGLSSRKNCLICADLEMVTNLCKSLTSGIHILEEVTEYMRGMFTREHPAADAHMASNKQNYEHNEVPLDTKISLLNPNQKDQKIEKQYHKSASLIMRDDLPLPGNVYLCTIQSRSGSVPILVNPLSSPTKASCLRLTLVRIL
jgi:hypothetical protein